MQPAFVRPFQPIELTGSTMDAFETEAMARQLIAEETFQQSGRNALTLIRHTSLTVVLTVLQAGAALHEHQAPAPVTLIPLFGEIVLSTAEGQTHLNLDSGRVAVFAAHLTHRVEAHRDSAFLLVMGGQASQL
jgi:quercetin dioxygenase-like cupin family protein